ncbi:MAG: hypothetical protein LBM41_07195 [Ruminococcus sp.]|jgi:hypothetical protein|nr:hypothetical protein [Ruminococcus sp.]
MTWFEDDSHEIPESIRNMPKEEVERKSAELLDQLRRERDAKRKKPLSA